MLGMRTATVLGVGSLLVGLTACGGPGPAENAAGGEAVSVIDRVPAPGSTTVFVDDPIEVVFDAAIDPESLSTDTVVLTTDEGLVLDRELELIDDGSRLLVRLTTRPDVPAALTLTLTNGVQSESGGSLVPPPDAHRFTLPAWLELGEPLQGTNDDDAVGVNVAVLEDDRPVVAFISGPSWWEGTLTLAQWGTAGWENVPHGFGPVVTGGGPSVALESNGSLLVAASVQFEGQYRVAVHRWHGGGEWDGLGEPIGTRGWRPWLASTSTGPPTVVLRDDGGGTVVGMRCAQWEDGAWSLLDTFVRWPDATFTGDAAGVRVALDQDGRPLVAFDRWVSDGSTSDGLYVFVSSWNGEEWRSLGGPVGDGSMGAIAVGADGRPIVAYFDGRIAADSDRMVRVRRWTGLEWAPVGGPLGTPGAILRQPHLAIDGSGRLVVSWREEGVSEHQARFRVARYGDGAWQELGAGITTTASAPFDDTGTHLTLDRSGHPVVAIRRPLPDSDGIGIVVARWNGP